MSTHPYTDYLSVVAPAHNSAFAAIDLPDHGICLWTDKDANILHPFFTLRICRSDGTLYEFNQPSPSLQLVDGVTGAVINPLGLNSQSRDRDRYFSTDNPLKNEGPFFLLAKKHTYMLMVHGHIIWRYNGLWVPYDPSQCVQMTPEMVMEDLMKKQQAVVALQSDAYEAYMSQISSLPMTTETDYLPSRSRARQTPLDPINHSFWGPMTPVPLPTDKIVKIENLKHRKQQRKGAKSK